MINRVHYHKSNYGTHIDRRRNVFSKGSVIKNVNIVQTVLTWNLKVHSLNASFSKVLSHIPFVCWLPLAVV